jgi:hypothetical protein
MKMFTISFKAFKAKPPEPIGHVGVEKWGNALAGDESSVMQKTYWLMTSTTKTTGSSPTLKRYAIDKAL